MQVKTVILKDVQRQGGGKQTKLFGQIASPSFDPWNKDLKKDDWPHLPSFSILRMFIIDHIKKIYFWYN